MTTSEPDVLAQSAGRVIDLVNDAEALALEAVRKFVDTVNASIPDVGEDGMRRRVIDSAFTMTEQLVSVSSEVARKVVAEANEALHRRPGARTPSR